MIRAGRVTTVATDEELRVALGPRPIGGRALALVGGADRLDHAAAIAVDSFFRTLARSLQALDMTLVDGGTDSGVMRLIGEARREIGGTFRLVGVAPGGVIDSTSRTGADIELEEHHPEIVLVPGDHFGMETAWLFQTADYLGSDTASTIVVNGGQLTLEEAGRRLDQGRRVIVVAGSGRAADVLAGRDPSPSDGLELQPEYLRSPGLSVIPLDIETGDLMSTLVISMDGGMHR